MTGPRTSPDNLSRADQRTIKIGTRGSPLALAQARQIAAALEVMSGGACRGEIVTFTTTGDRLSTERLMDAGGKGLFTKELDVALDDGRVDITVHSLKDVPTQLPDGQVFVAIPEREDPREGFLSRLCESPADLPDGATVGTASIRREAQTRRMRPDLGIVMFRGNVATRMRKLDEGLADATYLAMAGLTRLGLSGQAHAIPLETMLPAPSQGIISVVAREGELPKEAEDALAAVSDPAARAAAFAERAFLTSLDGSCRTPIAAHLFTDGGTFTLKGQVLSPDGKDSWEVESSVASDASTEALATLGAELGATLREAAGDALPAFS